ncbi:hypothetical protein N7G274_010245 [Stereocaulon virgatum]|uniref:Uncharacterized protein n=1 Tax=Stereocaulon virgatum TaxID=373712 RepID=A0ABR3ZW53_9LECA
MLSISRIAELASVIQAHTLIVDEYVSSHRLPSPSFDVSMPPQLHLPETIESFATAIIEATSELHSLLLGLMSFLVHQIDSPHNLISLHAISRFQIASSFLIDKETSFVEIARECQLDEDEIRRIIRHATTNHTFKKPKNGIRVHMAASKALVEVPLLREWLQQACDDMWPAASRFVYATVKWSASEEPSQTA